MVISKLIIFRGENWEKLEAKSTLELITGLTPFDLYVMKMALNSTLKQNVARKKELHIFPKRQ